MGKDIVENRKNSLVRRPNIEIKNISYYNVSNNNACCYFFTLEQQEDIVEAENNYTFSNINCFVLSQWMLKNIKTDKDKTAGKEAQLIVNTTRTNAVNLGQR